MFLFPEPPQPIALATACHRCRCRRAVPFYATSVTLYVKCMNCGSLFALSRRARRRRPAGDDRPERVA